MTDSRESGSAANAVPGHSEPPTWPRLALERRLAIRAALGLALAAAVLVLVWRLADWSQIGPAVRVLGTRPELFVVFLAGYTLAFGLRAFAWRQLIVSGGGVLSLFAILQAALLANHLLPFKLGEVARPALATRRGIPAAEAAASTAVARLLDFASLVAIASLGVLLLAPDGRMAWMQSLALPVAIVVGVASGLLILQRGSFHRRLPAPLQTRAAALRSHLTQMSSRRVAGATLWTLPSWVLEAVVLMVAAQALGIDVSPTTAIAVTAFTILFQVFHVTPGGIGVYEASMTGALYALGVDWQEGLAVAVLTHGMKFAYSYSVALLFTLVAIRDSLPLGGLGALRGTARGDKQASRFEILAARAWNVLNEGKPFTPVFVVGLIFLISLPHLTDVGYWGRAGLASVALLPMFLLFYRFDFPLRLRAALWAYLAIFLAAFRFLDFTAMALILGLYLAFTVVLWGTVYYHLRIGTSWLNFTRFWRLVLENPDPTSGNFLEQVPKVALLLLSFKLLVTHPTTGSFVAVEAFALGIGVSALLLHQWFFTWPPAPPLAPTRLRSTGRRVSRRFITIVIDGCRADRLLEANTPYIDRLRGEGADYVNASTVYPARTVTAFSSMLTGAPPKVHGMGSNFVPNLGVKCESIFDSLRASGMNGKLVGIAHLVDAFGDRDVETVTAVTDNDEIDEALAARARAVIQRDDPDLLVLQLLSVDQTGHARGSYNSEYLAKIEETDRVIERFLKWCESTGYLQDATVLITADHGQGIGIGGHGHMCPSERYVPCVLWGKGVERRGPVAEPRSVMDVAATISYYLGAAPPAQSVGQVLGVVQRDAEPAPVAVIVPSHNEADNLPDTLAAVPREADPDMKIIVVDDGSTDGTADVARRHGADVVISHGRNRGLGAALRTGLAAANAMNARAAVYIDADGEYPPAQIPDLLKPIEDGEADYVLGSRYLGTRRISLRQSFLRLAGNIVFTALLSLATGRRITDGQTGFRAFSRRALECAEIVHDYNYAQVLTLDLLKKGMRMREVPISYRLRSNGKSFIGASYLWCVPVGMLREMLSQ